MKRIFKVFLVCLILFCNIQTARAEESEDMSKWSFKILLQHSDQEDALKVVRFYNRESQRYGFCMEPLVDYDPVDHIYEKQEIRNEAVFDIFRAFELLGNDYYIAAQLMIWELNTGLRFSFEGKDAADYGENEILNVISGFKNTRKTDENIELRLKEGEIREIEINELSEYQVSSEEKNGIYYQNDQIIIDTGKTDQNQFEIVLEPKKDIYSGSALYHSEESQDLFSYEGDYKDLNRIVYKINIEDDRYDYYFRKIDTDGKNISGAEFTVFELNEQGDKELLFIRKGRRVDIRNLFDTDDDLVVDVSERYERYFDETLFYSNEIGFFPYDFSDGKTRHQGIAIVTEDDQLSNGSMKLYKAFEISHISSIDGINTVKGLQEGKSYILCETKPKKGYVFSSEAFICIDGPNVIESAPVFVNQIRHYDLKLYKENDEKTILLNGARFKLTYKEDGKEKEYIFVTGALNIRKDEEGQFVLYRHENDENIYVGEFRNGIFILENARPGTYYYRITDNTNVNDSSLLNRKAYVSNGAYLIYDIPYDAKIEVTELEAPKGYHIDEADFSISPDLDYSDLTFKNFRVNSFIIFPENRRKIPKTCIGN